MSYSIFKCKTRNEGKLSFGNNFGRLKLNNYGTIDHSNIDSSTIIYCASELDFFLAPEAITMLEQDFVNNTELEPTNVRSEVYSKYIGEVLPAEEAQKVESDILLYGYIKKVPELLSHTITFSDLTLKYSDKTKTYVSQGKLGIGSINKTQIHKYVNGHIELTQKRGGDRLTIYLDLGQKWYFFDYYNGLMSVFSSAKEWNDIIINTKAENRELKAKDGEKFYRFYISSSARKDRFLKKIASGIDDNVEQEEQE